MPDFKGSVAVVGLGYIGLPTAAALASRGLDVIGVDNNPTTIEAVSRGDLPFLEPDLAVVVSGAISQGLLRPTMQMPQADAFIIAVPTPFLEDRTADLSYVQSAVEAIAPELRGGEVIILESTSPPGTSALITQWLTSLRPDLRMPTTGGPPPDIFVAHCPERVLPGRIMIELVTNDRVVGGITPACARKAAAIYRVFCQGTIHITDAASAEMAKLVENAYRDVNIAFANELSLICEALRLDVWEVIEMANRHPRVNILRPGPGVGGHCIAVDPWFIIGAAPELATLIRTAREVNDGKPDHVVSQVVKKASRFRAPTIACLGLAYKAGVDDLRESPAVKIVEDIASMVHEATIAVAEPYIDRLPQELAHFDHVRLSTTEDAVENADIVVLLVDHEQFKAINRSRLSGKVIYDTRGIWH